MRLMAYLVDLILVMQILFLAVLSTGRPISRHLIKRVVNLYKDSLVKADVHHAVKQYVQGTGIFARTNRDNALDTVTHLINRYSKDPEILDLTNRSLLSNPLFVDDEPWDVPAARATPSTQD